MKNKKSDKKIPLKVQKPPKAASGNHYIYIIILIAITAILFSNALGHHFTNWDDDDYITKNPYILDLTLRGIQNIFTVFVSSHYHPLTLLSLALDYYLWGMNASGFIFTNIVFHIFNVMLVFLIFKIVIKRAELAFIVALLFAIHPMKVESVVWVAERKDVLFSFFYLMAVFFYVKYITSGFLKKYYVFTLILALLSLLSKATAASLPLILLVFDYYYKRKNLKIVFIEKLPFFIFSLVFGILAIIAQSSDQGNNPPFFDRIFLFTYAISFYIIKFFAPLYQSPLIEFPEKAGALLPLKYYVSFLIIPLVVFVIYKLKTVRKELIFAFSFFLLSMLLILIKFPIGPAYLTERYTYLPYIGLAFAIAVIYTTYFEKRYKKAALAVLIIWFVFLGIKTHFQNQIWDSSITLWTYVLERNPLTPIAYNNRGDAKYELKDYQSAIDDYNKAIEIKKQAPGVYSNRGNSKKELGDFKGAIADYDVAISMNPKYTEAYFNRALVKTISGDASGAISDFDKTIELKPDFAAPYYNRANLKFTLNDLDGALKDYNKSIELNPNEVGAYNNRGALYYKLKDFDKAINSFNTATKISPNSSDAYNNRAVLENELGNKISACADWQKAIQLNHPSAQGLYDKNCK